MLYRKKILIFTADAGFGHRRAAMAIASAISENYGPLFECQILNPAEDPRTPEIIRRPQVDYDLTVLDHPRAYNLSYRISDFKRASMMVQDVIAQLMVDLFRGILRVYQPDAVISTYLIYNAALRLALRRNDMDVPLFIAITDLADVHHLWLQPGPDKYFLPSEEARKKAILSEVPSHKILVTGLPVDPGIVNEKRGQAQLRQVLGWSPDLLTILAVGSHRVKDLPGKLQAINALDVPLQLVIVAGGDQALFQAARDAYWNKPVFCYNFVHNLPEMLHASNFLITKAGGLICAEALACGLPIIFTEALPGQELGNVDYVCKHSAGVMAKTPEEMGRILQDWTETDRKILALYAKNAKALGKPDAANQIAREVWKAILDKDRTRIEDMDVKSRNFGASAWES